VIVALTSPTVASGSTSIDKGKPRANDGGFAAVDIVNNTIFESCTPSILVNFSSGIAGNV
jgi:hypothetical protein